MAEARKKQFIPREKARSPFAILPGYLRALGPHQGRGWWNFGQTTQYDFLQLRQDILNDDRHVKDGEFKRFSKNKEVRCLIYNFDIGRFTPEDVVDHVIRLGLDIVDELQPRMDGSNPLLDVRVSCMTSYLWKLLELCSGFIDSFNFSTQLAVGIDDGSAGLHGWGSFTHVGRNCLSAEQIPWSLEKHLNDCGVHAIILTQTLESDWAHSISSSGRFSLAVRHESEWKKLQAIPFKHKYIQVQEITGVGSILELASSKGDFAVSAAVGRFPLDVLSLPPPYVGMPFYQTISPSRN
jgi:hypothetical protein